MTQLEHAEWLAARGREDEASALLDETREIFDGVKATPWLERADALSAARVPA